MGEMKEQIKGIEIVKEFKMEEKIREKIEDMIDK